MGFRRFAVYSRLQPHDCASAPLAVSDPLQPLLKEPFSRLSRRYLKLAGTRKITPADVLVLLSVADKTVSWRRLWAELSYSDIEDATGLSRRHVGRTISGLLTAGLLARKTLGDGHTYALVPEGWTAAEVIAASASMGVDKSELSASAVGTSCPQYQGHHVPSSADPSFVFKKRLKKAAGAAVLVDNGLRARASSSCPTCGGEGWVVSVLADGFTEAVAPCPCTSETASA